MTGFDTDLGHTEFVAALDLVDREFARLDDGALERICTLAGGVATDVLAAPGGQAVAASGTGAFLAGFLLGRSLARRAGVDPRLPLEDELAAAVDLVRSSGRTTVIARVCDLAAVAAAEHRLSVALMPTADASCDPWLLSGVERCFEAGLAVALALAGAMVREAA